MEKDGLMEKYCTHIAVTDRIRLDLFTPACFRVRISSLAGEPFPPQYEIPFAVGHTQPWAPVDCRVSDEGPLVRAETEELIIRVWKETGEIYVEDAGGKRLYPVPAPKYGMFLNHCIVFDSASFHQEYSTCSRYAHWFYGKESGLYDVFLAEDAMLDTFFVHAPTYREGYARFSALVGEEPMLPKKGYGYYQTQHLSADGTQERLLRTARLLREHDIPCDTLILDYEWGDGANGGKELPWGSRLTWSEEYASPLSPAEMIAKLKKMHFDVMVIHHSVPAYEGRSDEGWVCCEYPADVWWREMERLLQDGISGTWQDTRQTDVTNARIYAGLERRTGRRVSMLSDYDVLYCYSWAKGSVLSPYKQRIGGRRTPFFWTGDMTFWEQEELAFQVNAIVNEHGALKGISYLTNDAMRPGGTLLGARCDAFLALNSMARSHNHKPWEGNHEDDDIAGRIAIGGEEHTAGNKREDELLGLAHSDETREAVTRKYLKLRYRLLPYLYTAARQTYDTGLPLTRPLMVAFEEDEHCSRNQYPLQYMLGDDLLVCPVCHAQPCMNVYLPAGCNWVDFFTGAEYAGGREYPFDVSDPACLPLFVRAGSVIPMRADCNWIGEEEKELYLVVFGEGKGALRLYEDDGVSLGYRSGDCAFLPVTSEADAASVLVTIAPAEGKFPVLPRRVCVRWKGKEAWTEYDGVHPCSVRLNV